MRGIAIVVVVCSLAFFLAGFYEWSMARESARWPGRAAKITAYQVHRGEEDGGSYVSIEGVFVDTQRAFTAKRYAYAVVNGMSPGRKHLAPYKPGYMTEVYVDPKDARNVILCNTPSLRFQYGELAVTAGLFLASLLYLALGRKHSARSSFRAAPRTVELPRWAGLAIGLAMAGLFLGLGAWLIHMGHMGHSPAQQWSPGEGKIVMLMGLLFAYGGLACAVRILWGERIPPIVDRILLSLFLVVLGLPFIAIPLLDPGGISSSVSVNGAVVHSAKGSSAGAVVFMAAGILCLAGALWPWRWWKRRKR